MRRLSLAFLGLIFATSLGGMQLFAQHGRGGGGLLGGVQGTVQGVTQTDLGAHEASRQGPLAMGQNDLGATLQNNSQLASNLQANLPSGTNLKTASAGFESVGDFVSAVNVSHNLEIPFDQLKSKVTGPDAVSLGKAIHELRPDISSKEANQDAKESQRQAKEQIRASGKAKAKDAARTQSEMTGEPANQQREETKERSNARVGANAGANDQATANAGGVSVRQQGEVNAQASAHARASGEESKEGSQKPKATTKQNEPQPPGDQQ